MTGTLDLLNLFSRLHGLLFRPKGVYGKQTMLIEAKGTVRNVTRSAAVRTTAT
jgi:hypothetical protein